MIEPVFAVRGSDGTHVYKGVDNPSVIYEKILERKQNQGSTQLLQAHLQIRCFQFSPNGKYFAYCDGERTVILETESWKTYMELDGLFAKTVAVHFSPNSTYFSTWQTFFTTKKQQQQQQEDQPPPKPQPNMHVFKLETKALFLELVEKSRQNWHLHWTQDEVICARLVGSELLFHENDNLNKYCHKLVIPKLADYSLSETSSPLHVAAYVPIGKDTPAVVRVFRYPEFHAAVAAKTFFKADRVSMKWNKKGTALIIMAIIDIDSTGQSYYGEQNLYFVSTNGDSYMVPLAKSGPVYTVEWSPNSAQYCVVYGYMPAKATLYNLKGDALFDFGTGPRNEAYYDPFGKLLCICGFGNLRGYMEFWDVVNKKRLSQFTAEDTTVFRWCPDGQHFLTATTAPRLRVNNGWKIWRYDGTVISKKELPANDELWDVIWCPNEKMTEKDTLKCAPTSSVAQTGRTTNLPGVNKDSVYVPPHLRGVANKPTFKLQEFELPSNEKQQETNKGKNKKKPLAKSDVSSVVNKPPQQQQQQPSNQNNTSNDKDKKIKNLNKKLEQIMQLKSKLEAGEKMELNQLEKMKKEDEIREELDALQLS